MAAGPLSEGHPTPTAGWVVLMRIPGGKDEMKIEEVAEVKSIKDIFKAGIVHADPGIDTGVVLDIGEWPQAEEHIQFKKNSKVWFPADRGFDILGYYFIQWQSVICFKNEDD
jgi:hypothetical protein